MAYYVALNTAAVRLGEGREAEVEAVTLEHESVSVLPVFTSEERFGRFFGTVPGEGGRINPMATYPFELAEMVAKMEAHGEIEALVFDPVRTVPEGWRSVREPIRVKEFVRFTTEIRPGVERLVAESKATFGLAPPGTEAFSKAMRGQLPRIMNVVEDAKARMSEWNR
jgi:hypothetical protein